jgi:flagellar biosynthesis/type III secretory pathway M-ring protein FliF/YscJ
VVVAAGGPPVGAIIAIVAIIVAGIVLFPLVRAFARRLERPRLDDASMAELEHLRARVAELEQVQQRVMELEERVDFSERLLTQRSPELVRRTEAQ